ncbi:MAG: GNAT family protein, partial [Pseudomonadota bacterium]
AATLVLDRWFGAGAEKATSGHLFDNPASRRVLTKLGFVETGRSKAHANSRGGPVEHVDMVLTRAAWESGRSSRAGRPGDAEDPRA